MGPIEAQRLPEPEGRAPPTIFVNVSPTTRQENSNKVSQDGVVAFLAGVAVGVVLALSYQARGQTSRDE